MWILVCVNCLILGLTGGHDALHTLCKERWRFSDSCRAPISGKEFHLLSHDLMIQFCKGYRGCWFHNALVYRSRWEWNEMTSVFHRFMQTGDFLDVAIFSWKLAKGGYYCYSVLSKSRFRNQFSQASSSLSCPIEKIRRVEVSSSREGGYARLDTLGPLFRIESLFCKCM
jgi:hypothetical protein